MTKFRNGDRVMHRDHDWAVTVIADGPGPNGWIPVVNDDGNFNCLAAGFLSLVPLADPAPVGLTEDEIDAEVTARLSDTERMGWVVAEKLAEENLRLSAAPVDDRERVPEGWRVEWIECRHYRPEESHPVPRLIEIVPSCEGHRRLVPVSPSVDPEEKP